MTKLRWDKADQYEPDPGAVVDVPESTRPSRWIPPQERARTDAERVKKGRELRERSQQHDLDLVMARGLKRVLEKQARGEPLGFFDRVILNYPGNAR